MRFAGESPTWLSPLLAQSGHTTHLRNMGFLVAKGHEWAFEISGPPALLESPRELHLVDDDIGPSPIFRLPNHGLQWDHVLGEEIVNAIQAHELTGFTLQEVVVE